MDELKACPFCGVSDCLTVPSHAFHKWVQCNNIHCQAEGPLAETRELAIESWNTRAAHSVIAGKVAELEGALRPFSQKADAIERRDKVWRRARSADGYTVAIRLGDCRKARAALAQTKGTDR